MMSSAGMVLFTVMRHVCMEHVHPKVIILIVNEIVPIAHHCHLMSHTLLRVTVLSIGKKYYHRVALQLDGKFIVSLYVQQSLGEKISQSNNTVLDTFPAR